MSTEITVALIALAGVLFTAAASVVTQLVLAKKSQNEIVNRLQRQSELNDASLDAKLEKHQAVTDTKIEELTRKVEKHNNLIERTYRLEGAVTELQHDVRDLKDKPQ